MKVVTPRVLVAVEEAAVVVAAVEKIQDAIVVSPVEGNPVASKLSVVLPHKVAGPAAELAVDGDAAAVVEVHSLDIVALVLEEDLALVAPACVVEDHVRAVGEVDRYEGCR